MSDYVQILVDQDATLEDAAPWAETVLHWMQSNGVVAMTPATNATVVGWAADHGLPPLEESIGWPPGAGYGEWVADPNPSMTRDLLSNWFSIEAGPQVQVVNGEESHPSCPSGHVGDTDPAMTAVGEWFEGATASLHCTTCARAYPVAEWDLGPNMCVGFLSFRFENWGPLSPGLLRTLEGLLAPHRTKFIAGTRI